MVGGIGSNGSAMDAIKAAMQRQAEAAQRLAQARARMEQGAVEEAPAEVDFSSKLEAGLDQINRQVQLGDQLVDDIVTGEVSDFHEVAAQIKQADLSFKFTLAVRNKFVDAYREIMRMSV